MWSGYGTDLDLEAANQKSRTCTHQDIEQAEPPQPSTAQMTLPDKAMEGTPVSRTQGIGAGEEPELPALEVALEGIPAWH